MLRWVNLYASHMIMSLSLSNPTQADTLLWRHTTHRNATWPGFHINSVVRFLPLFLFFCERKQFTPSAIICAPLIRPFSCGNPISPECLCRENMFNVLSGTLKHKTIHEHVPGDDERKKKVTLHFCFSKLTDRHSQGLTVKAWISCSCFYQLHTLHSWHLVGYCRAYGDCWGR